MRAVFKTKTNQDHTHMLHVWVYLLPKLGDLVRPHVSKYSSTMVHMGYAKKEAGNRFFLLGELNRCPRNDQNRSDYPMDGRSHIRTGHGDGGQSFTFDGLCGNPSDSEKNRNLALYVYNVRPPSDVNVG